jgi:2-(1,2-epoxy-1,2-dihydrophenyl)acetyl-CoA isomerase
MSNFTTIDYQVSDYIATLTLNRPERFNAFNTPMNAEVIEAIKQAKRSDEVRVVIITGSGEKAFCSGQDLKEVAGQTRSLGQSVAERYSPMIKAIMTLEKPVIAQVNGVAAGAGASFALACDLVIAADTASFVFAFVNIGLVLDSGASFTLPRFVGRQKAFELATLGDKVTAQQALELGMVNQVVPFAELATATRVLAQRYTEKPPLAVGLMKRMLQRSSYSSLDQMLELEMYCQEIAGNSDDYKEGVAAFVEKRSPQFKGR